MEGVNNEGTSTDPPMTPIERQMQVIATSIQELARETTRQNKELWQAIRKEPPTPPRPLDDNQPPPQREGRREDQEADSRWTTTRIMRMRTHRKPFPLADIGRKVREAPLILADIGPPRSVDRPKDPIIRLVRLEDPTIKPPIGRGIA
jgi:hypothetical protein